MMKSTHVIHSINRKCTEGCLFDKVSVLPVRIVGGYGMHMRALQMIEKCQRV
jgi:hypothetical protein